MNVCTSIQMLAIPSSAKNTYLDIVHKWHLGSTFFPNVALVLVGKQFQHQQILYLFNTFLFVIIFYMFLIICVQHDISAGGYPSIFPGRQNARGDS